MPAEARFDLIAETAPLGGAERNVEGLRVEGLTVEGLTVQLTTEQRPLLIDVSFGVRPGEVVGLVGESGSGKSLACLSVLGLQPSTMQVTGHVQLGERNCLGQPDSQWRAYRAREARLVFQDPWAALNPNLSVGYQLVESLRTAREVSRAEARSDAIEMLRRVGITEPALRMRSYPRQLSGGMLQRVVIAMALLARPRLLICDEPTTALDVTTETQILELLHAVCAEFNICMILTTHDLGVADRYTDRLVVMYRGRVVETGSTDACLHNPHHPYTVALTSSMPGATSVAARTPLPVLERDEAQSAGSADGCRFGSRCQFRVERCMLESPPLAAIHDRSELVHEAACWVTANSADLSVAGTSS